MKVAKETEVPEKRGKSRDTAIARTRTRGNMIHNPIKRKNKSETIKGILRYQKDRQKSLSLKTSKTMTNKIKQRTNIEHTKIQ